MSGSTSTEFDLKPDPRILPMLGEINLAQWRCLAELVDNSIDGFLSLQQAGVEVGEPEISVMVPTRVDETARVTVADNGPGMSTATLENAVRAGWSGNNPIDSLGMFGMGFNIATARLGTVTTVWTSQQGNAEEHGLRIDFEELRKQGHFRTPRQVRPKTDPQKSGTSITIERLKPEQQEWLAKPGNRARIKKELSRAYSAMLRHNGVPLSFALLFQGRRVSAVDHCVWSEDRSVDTPRHGTVFAVQKIDRKLPDRPFCTYCWQWLIANEEVCVTCQGKDQVVARRRHVHGWVGLQRYLSSTNYGIDFIRNGRKIEIGNRELFFWRDPSGDAEELEYPIDDVRQRGRFVGEIHLDHCRVTYMKDRFDRTDPAWDEMVGIVRGQGPLQPQKAASLGFSVNDSPMFKLYQAFRRSSPPKARMAGQWSKVLAVKDNDRAEDMAKKFHDGVPEYQTDDKWWELVQEEDNRLLTASTGPTAGPGGGDAAPGSNGGSGLSGFGGSPNTTSFPTRTSDAPPSPPTPAPAPPPRQAVPSLSREYSHDGTALRWDVAAYRVQPDDPGLGGPDHPWACRRLPQGTDEFFINADHSIFRSATMTELDALLCELAYKAADFSRSQPNAPPFCVILADLRERYAGQSKLDPFAMANAAEILFRSIARAWPTDIDAEDADQLFNGLQTNDQVAIYHRMAARAVPHPQQAISDGRFLEYAPSKVIVDFVLSHPDLFFDGRCWEDPYSDLDYSQESATQEARRRLLRGFEALLLDALWLSEVDPEDLALVPREKALRAMLAVELLTPTPSQESSL